MSGGFDFSHLLTIIDAASRLHEAGYIHRDLTPGNFLIDRKGNITLIDVELAYCVRTGIPDPPFGVGTPGFYSPEQELGLIPTVKEDVYGLGALLIAVFVGITPDKFDVSDPEELAQRLDLFIRNSSVVNLIRNCLDADPEKRPTVDGIQTTLFAHLEEQKITKPPEDPLSTLTPIPLRLIEDEIHRTLHALSHEPAAIHEGIWYTKMTPDDPASKSGAKEYRRYFGLFQGLSGALYVMAKAAIGGHAITAVEESIASSWAYIFEKGFDPQAKIRPGLNQGAAGIALALATSIKAGIQADNATNKGRIKTWFQAEPDNLTVASGWAGTGIALLQCRQYLDSKDYVTLLDRTVASILAEQERDGSWYTPAFPGKPPQQWLGFDKGVSGITWFLLEYLRHHRDSRVETAVVKALQWLNKRTRGLDLLWDRATYRKINHASPEHRNIRMGIYLTYLKAYQVLRDPFYKMATESSLRHYPPCLVNTNLGQAEGLVGLGELYWEASQVFDNGEWVQRATWITKALLGMKKLARDDFSYWLVDDTQSVTADLMVGMGGILHYLLRCHSPGLIGLPMLG
jgi:hypothetical protein